MALFDSTNEGLGLDIGTSNVKAVWLKKSRRLIRLMAYNTLPIDPTTFSKNAILKKNELILAIKDLLKKSKLRPISLRRVNCALPEIMTFVKTLKLPEMPQEELENAINWEIKQFVPLPIDEVYWDWQIINKNAGKQDIFLSVAPKKIVDDFYEIIKNAGLEMNALEVEPLVVSRALINKALSDKCVLIADIGSQTTNLSIFDNGSIHFTHNTLIGGKSQTENLAKSFNIDLNQSEKLKISLPDKSKLQARVQKSIEPLLKDLVDEIKKAITFYEEQSHKKTDLILLCGGGANLLGVDQYLSKTLNLPVKIGNPWANVTIYPLKTVPHDEVPIYTQAIGSALRDLKD